MKAVFRLVEYSRIFSFHRLVGYLFPPVRGQAVQDDGAGLCLFKQLRVYLKATEMFFPRGLLRLLAH